MDVRRIWALGILDPGLDGPFWLTSGAAGTLRSHLVVSPVACALFPDCGIRTLAQGRTTNKAAMIGFAAQRHSALLTFSNLRIKMALLYLIKVFGRRGSVDVGASLDQP